MKAEHGAKASLTKEGVKRAAVLALHTYDGATTDEWQDQADTLREGDGGDTAGNEDSNLSQMIADALREMDESLAEQLSR
jgi:hypothetical protein